MKKKLYFKNWKNEKGFSISREEWTVENFSGFSQQIPQRV